MGSVILTGTRNRCKMCAIVWNNLFLYGVSYSWVKDPLVPNAKQKEKEKKREKYTSKAKNKCSKNFRFQRKGPHKLVHNNMATTKERVLKVLCSF